MIKYNFGERACILDWNIFLRLIINNVKKYKNEFKDFYSLYEFIEKNKKNISHILLDGYEYFLENGVLHNLYGPAYIRYNDENTNPYQIGTETYYFYINGRLVCDKLDIRGCRKLESFKKDKIFFYKELTNKKTMKEPDGTYYRRKEGIDYLIENINLEQRIKNDQRKKKLKQINYNLSYISS